MRLADQLRTTTFLLTLRYMVLFFLSVTILFAFINWSATGTLEQEIDATVQADVAGLNEQFIQQGPQGLARVIAARISADPAWPRTTFLTGQPMLMSMIAAPRSALSFAASAITAGSQPASCTAIGNSSGAVRAMVSVRRAARIIAWLAIISETTSPAPWDVTKRRNGRSVTPDMGARTTGLSSATEPMEKVMFAAMGRSCPKNRHQRR